MRTDDTTAAELTAADTGPTLQAVEHPAPGYPAPGYSVPGAPAAPAAPAATAAAPAAPAGPEGAPAGAPAAPAAPALAPVELTPELMAMLLGDRAPAPAAPAARPTPAELAAGAGTPTGAAGVPAAPRTHGAELTLARVSGMIAGYHRGETTLDSLTAALGITKTTDAAGIVPPAYIAEIAGLVSIGRPLVEAMRRRQLPASGMAVTYPHWKTLPTVDDHVEGAQPSSTKAELELVNAPVKVFAGANELTVETVDRSDPSAVEALLIALAELYARKCDAAAFAGILAAVGGAGSRVGLQGKSAAEAFPLLLADLSPTATPAGGLFVAVAWDVYAADFAGLTDAEKPAWWNGQVSFAGPADAPAVGAGGLTVVVDPLLPAGTWTLGARNACTWWDDAASPATVQVVQVGVLSLDVGLYGYSAFTAESPGGLSVGNTTVAPVAARRAK